MSDFAALARTAIADLGAGPGVLADWLEERADPRGVLLRRRWKRWQTARGLSEKAEANARKLFTQQWSPVVELVRQMGGKASAEMVTTFAREDDDSLRKYIRRRFRDAFAIDLTNLTESAT